MGNRNMIYGIFDSDDKLLDAAYKMKEMGVQVEDCYTPHPVHHLDSAIGAKRTRLTIGAFICGSIGFICAIILETYMNVFDWPMNIGGKPNDGYYPVFIPVTFEMTVLFTAFGMAFLFFVRTKMLHGVKEKLVDLRQTDDLYIMAINVAEQKISAEEISGALTHKGAIEIRTKAHYETQQA